MYDEALTPTKMTCVKCGNEITVYPYPMPEGTGVCPCSSPAWLESFAKFGMNSERTKRGLSPIN
ncbi:hypothetical protein LCGC14_0927130 [marine sediment metagenome]|uniref:Uncharacterized protein n=1 Tax=marine sediment metagenome TaxID=412755 RepID=A0A0F9PA15_9ZZZZ